MALGSHMHFKNDVMKNEIPKWVEAYQKAKNTQTKF